MQKPADFTAMRLEPMTILPPGKFPLNRQMPYLIGFVEKGSGNGIIGQYSFPVADNTLFIVPSLMEHSVEFTGDELNGSIICFTTELLVNKAFPRHLVESKAVLNGSLKPHVPLDGEQALCIRRVMDRLVLEYENGATNLRADEMVCVKVLELLILCERFFRTRTRGAAPLALPREVVTFQKMLEKEFSRHHTVHYYSGRQNLYPDKLNALVQQHCGLRVKALINQKLTREAKYLLALGDLSVKQIAAQLGFGDANYFSCFFKNATGLSPLDYRRINGPSGR